MNIIISVSFYIKIYKLYKQEKHAIDNWAKADSSLLNPHLLLEGIDAYITEFSKLDTWVCYIEFFLIELT